MENLKGFLIDAAVRAVRTAAQTTVGILGAASVMSDVDWRMVASAAALAGLTSILMSLNNLTGPGPALPEAKNE